MTHGFQPMQDGRRGPGAIGTVSMTIASGRINRGGGPGDAVNPISSTSRGAKAARCWITRQARDWLLNHCGRKIVSTKGVEINRAVSLKRKSPFAVSLKPAGWLWRAVASCARGARHMASLEGFGRRKTPNTGLDWPHRGGDTARPWLRPTAVRDRVARELTGLPRSPARTHRPLDGLPDLDNADCASDGDIREDLPSV